MKKPKTKLPKYVMSFSKIAKNGKNRQVAKMIWKKSDEKSVQLVRGSFVPK